MRTNHESQRESKHAGPIAWTLAAFGLLAVGVIIGALAAGKAWAWAAPVAGFLGYLLAFRQALLALVSSPEAIDGAWRALEGPEDSLSPPAPERSRRAERLIHETLPFRLADQSSAVKRLQS
jgi:hypothetical protein